MKRTFKYIFIGIFGVLAILILLFYGGSRRSLKSVYDYEVNFAKANASNIKELLKYIKEKNIIPKDNEKIFIQFFWRRGENIVIRVRNENSEIEKYESTPNFIPAFFKKNQLLSIQIEDDGVIFNNIFSSYSFKKCSFKYFSEPHNLYSDSIYKDKYIITGFDNLNKFSNACLIVDSNWLLLTKPDNFKNQ
jgi:hypothetical protein